jgi:ribosomal protein S18 acetylase RimI-like enzyme
MAVCIRRIVSREEQECYLPLLLIANPSKELLHRDLARGDLHTLEDGGQVISCAIVAPLNKSTCELLILTTRTGYERTRYAKVLLHYLFAIYRDSYHSMVVGTADFDNKALALYESQGFRRIKVIGKQFIDNYPQEVFDEDRLCPDLVVLERVLI